MEVLEKAAEILEAGLHGVDSRKPTDNIDYWHITIARRTIVEIEPFADTLEGRRQSDSIENWLCEYEHSTWHLSEFDVCEQYENSRENISNSQWRSDRIKWCLEQLANDS